MARAAASAHEAKLVEHSERDAIGEPLPWPIDSLPTPDALGCGTPCAAGVLSANHPYYNVFLSCANGSFTARTGLSHSVTLAGFGPQNVIFGGQTGSPGTSDITFFVHDTGTAYQNPIGGAACVFDPPDTPTEVNSTGVEMEWNEVPMPGVNLVLREEIVAFGDTEANSGVRLTLGITNASSSSQAVTVGMRWQIDYQNGSDDGPLYAPVICDPPSTGAELSLEHEFTPAEILDFYRIQNNAGFPIFSNVTSTTPLNGFANTARPDRLIFASWGSASGSPWTYATNEGAFGPDLDSAVLYYFGYQRADGFVLEPGESVTRSTIIFTAAGAVDCGELTPGCAPDVAWLPQDQAICLGDSTTLDGSGISVENCEGMVEYEWSDPMGWISSSSTVDVAPTADTDYRLEVSCSSDPDCLIPHDVTVSVERPPVLSAGLVEDPSPCLPGLALSWDPASFFDPSATGVYNVYRSEFSCADALLQPPLVSGLSAPTWFDDETLGGASYFYVIEAEDARSPTVCAPQGPHHGGAVGHLCLGPNLDAPVPLWPDVLGIVLFASHDADQLSLNWSTSRALLEGEHFHVLKSSDSPKGPFALANGEADLALSWQETDMSANVQFFDLRVANACERLSVDEFPPSR